MAAISRKMGVASDATRAGHAWLAVLSLALASGCSATGSISRGASRAEVHADARPAAGGERAQDAMGSSPERDESDGADESWDELGWDDEEGWEEHDWETAAESGRSFLYKEVVLSAFYSGDGLTGLPPGDPEVEHVGLNPRPPSNYIGVDYVRTFTDSSSANTKVMPSWLPLTAIDLHPLILYDRMDTGEGLDVLAFAPQDFWARFNPGGKDRLSLRLGQFVLPYGVNPPLAPRQSFILPVESTDLGLKWDWGATLKGPLGGYDWELAATIGSGMALHSTKTFSGSDESSYLLTGRIGTPTYWDLQYGLSFLYGDLPTVRAAAVIDENSISRWRLSLDGLYKYGTYLLSGAQLTYGQDGFKGDERFVRITMGETADVLGYRLWSDWVLPAYQDWRIGAQFESVIRDLSTSGTDDTALIFETRYSLTNSTSLMLDFRHELNRSMGDATDAIYFTFIYYGE